MDPNETPLTPAEDTQSPQPSQNSQSSPPRRHYTLWELVRHLDDDTPADTADDTAGSVLASIRPSAWPD